MVLIGRQTWKVEGQYRLFYKERRKERGTDVDDLETLLEQLVGFFWEVVLDAIFGCFIGLVDVDSLAWATEGSGPIASILGGTTNRMVKDEDSVGSSAVNTC